MPIVSAHFRSLFRADATVQRDDDDDFGVEFIRVRWLLGFIVRLWLVSGTGGGCPWWWIQWDKCPRVGGGQMSCNQSGDTAAGPGCQTGAFQWLLGSRSSSLRTVARRRRCANLELDPRTRNADCVCIQSATAFWVSVRRCGPLLRVSPVAWSQCVPVYWAHRWAVRKRLNRS